MGHITWAIIAGLASAIFLFGAHWFPWTRVLGRSARRPWYYAIGMIGLLVPYSVWGLATGRAVSVGAMWIVTVMGGGAVLAAYAIRDRLDRGAQEESRKRLRERADAIPGGPEDCVD